MRLLIFYSISCCSYAQIKTVGTPYLKNYRRIDYHSGTQNWDIDQDVNGNVYFANNNGLLQYDGTSWRNYTMSGSQAVRSVKVDNSTGRIYVGGYNEFGYFKSNINGALTYISLSNTLDKAKQKDFEFIWRIHILKNTVIFQSFDGAYLFKDGELHLLEAPDRFQFSFMIDQTLYFQDMGKGILAYKNDTLIPLKGTKEFNNKEIWGLFALPENALLIATLNNGLFLYENGSIKPWKTPANDFVKKNSGLGGVSINQRFIVLNTVLNGLIICDPSGEILQHINLNKGLQNNTLLKSYVDDQSNLWLGLDNGISYVNENSPTSFLGSSYNLSTVYASTVYHGSLYAATNQGVFYHPLFKGATDNDFKLVQETNAQTWNIQQIDGQLVAASNRGALVIEGGKVSKILDTQGYFGFRQVKSQPSYWVGSNYNGLSLFEKTNNGLIFRNQIKGFQKSSNSFAIDQDFLWLLKDGILYQMNFSKDFKDFINIRQKELQRSNNLYVDGIHEIDSMLYFRSGNQFYTFSKASDTFQKAERLDTLFSKSEGLSNLIEDRLGNLWFSAEEALGVFMKNDNYREITAPFQYLKGNLVNNYLSINAVNPQNIYIGFTDGLAHYNPLTSHKTAVRPKVFIRSLSYGNHIFKMGNPQQIPFEETIPYKQNNIKFTFSSPTFQTTSPTQYSYLLKPFNKQWSNWSANPLKEYTNLREGNYTMQVRARSNNGSISHIENLNFDIAPPWYRSIMAFVVYMILFALLIYLVVFFIKIRLRRDRYYQTIEQRKLYLEKESRIRSEQYKLEKEIERLRRDKLQTKLLSKDKELVNNSLQIINKNKILNEIIKKLKDFDTKSLNENNKQKINKLQHRITKELNTDKNFSSLENHIKSVHFEFLKRLKEKHPDVTPRELDLSIYLLLNMSTKEIAEIMNISTKGVELARYRLRKKLKLKRKQGLTGFMMKI